MFSSKDLLHCCPVDIFLLCLHASCAFHVKIKRSRSTITSVMISLSCPVVMCIYSCFAESWSSVGLLLTRIQTVLKDRRFGFIQQLLNMKLAQKLNEELNTLLTVNRPHCHFFLNVASSSAWHISDIINSWIKIINQIAHIFDFFFFFYIFMYTNFIVF